MKILFINTLYAPHIGGGAERTLQLLVEGLASRGHDVSVLTTSDQPGLHHDEVNGVRVWRAGLRNVYWHFRKRRPNIMKRRLWHAMDSYNPLMTGYVKKVVETEQPDVVSCHNLPGWSVSVWRELHKLKVPIVQVLHDQYLLCPGCFMFKNGQNCETQCAGCRVMRLPHRGQSKRVSAVVGVSRFILERHRQFGMFDDVPLQRVIHNARSGQSLGIENVDGGAPDEVDPKRPVRFGFIGTLAPNKGVELLIRQFADWSPAGTGLWVAGSGRADYEAELRSAAGDSAIHFMGQVPAREFYSSVDAVVIPSLCNDTFPGVVFESLAFGKSVIASRRGGIPEMLEDGVNGLLFEPNRSHELVSALHRLASDPALRKRIGESGRESASPYMDPESWVGRYISVYDEIVTN